MSVLDTAYQALLRHVEITGADDAITGLLCLS